MHEFLAGIDWVSVVDVAGTLIGLLYLWLEYKASIWLWAVSVIMPIVHGYLYYARGLYADFGMEIYYVLAAIYGYALWVMKSKKNKDKNQRDAAQTGITHFPLRQVPLVAIATAGIWAGIYWLLITFTNSNVPVLDSFTTALSVVALWALAQKYAEQWLLWLVVDAVCTGLYIYKQIPFTAGLYGFYTIAAVLGYRKWCRLAGGH